MEDCGKCHHCLDKLKFGGEGYLKQVCVHKQCPNKRYAPPASAVTPEARKKETATTESGGVARGGVADGERRVVSLEADFEKGKPPSAAASATGGESSSVRAVASGRSERRLQMRRRGRTRRRHDSPARGRPGRHAPAPSVVVPVKGGDGVDAHGLATAPFLRANAAAISPASSSDRDSLLVCRMELERAQSENKRQADEIERQADEIKRLKLAVRALTA